MLLTKINRPEILGIFFLSLSSPLLSVACSWCVLMGFQVQGGIEKGTRLGGEGDAFFFSFPPEVSSCDSADWIG